MRNKYCRLQSRNSKYREELKKNATKEEIIFKKFLEKEKIKFIFQKGFLKPYHRICDFYIKKYRLIVEIDGGYHQSASVIYKDKVKDQVWSRFRTLRLTNEEINNGLFKEIFFDFV